MKYFYIIQFDGGITELEYSLSKYQGAAEALQKGGVAVLEDMNGNPLIFNSGTISKILVAEQYDAHLDAVRPQKYPLRGIWYDRRGEIVRYEPWKQKMIDDNKKLQLEKETSMTDADKKKAQERIAQMMKDANWGK